MSAEVIVQRLHQHHGLPLFALGLRVYIDPLEHKLPEPFQRALHRLRHDDSVPPAAVRHDIVDEMIDPLRGIIADHVADLSRHIVLRQNPGPYRVVHVVMDIGDLVGKPHHLSLQRGGRPSGLMVQDAVPHLHGQVQSLSPLFQKLYGPHALHIVCKTKGTDIV